MSEHSVLHSRTELLSSICGQLRGYQFGSQNGFYPYYSNPSLTIDDLYVDGVSITYGSAPRRHIWTYVNGLNLVYCTELRMNCPWELN